MAPKHTIASDWENGGASFHDNCGGCEWKRPTYNQPLYSTSVQSLGHPYPHLPTGKQPTSICIHRVFEFILLLGFHRYRWKIWRSKNNLHNVWFKTWSIDHRWNHKYYSIKLYYTFCCIWLHQRNKNYPM